MDLLIASAAGLASMVAGMVWYAPSLAGNAWKKLTAAERAPRMNRGAALPLAAHFACSVVIALLLNRANLPMLQTYHLAGMMWLVFSVLLRLPQFLLEGRSMKLFLIYAGHDLLTFATIGTVVTLWP